ncbi:hypothetical protein AAHE18_16G005300 [Arachis hypogaea]
MNTSCSFLSITKTFLNGYFHLQLIIPKALCHIMLHASVLWLCIIRVCGGNSDMEALLKLKSVMKTGTTPRLLILPQHTVPSLGFLCLAPFQQRLESWRISSTSP